MTNPTARPVLRALKMVDHPDRWRALGFTVEDRRLALGHTTLEFADDDRGSTGIVGWTLQGIDPVESIDGLATDVDDSPSAADPVRHENGALSLDHVVVTTPGFDRTSAVLAEVGLELRRVREAPGGVRQGFRRLGEPILELVEIPGASDPAAPAEFWGLVVVVADLDDLAQRVGSLLGPPKPAVQPGRRIATLRPSAGVGPAVAFMTPEAH